MASPHLTVRVSRMQKYLNWKETTIQKSSLGAYKRWVALFLNVVNKDEGFTIEDITTFRLFLERAEYSPRNIQFGLHILHDYISYLMAAEGLDFPLYLFRIKQQRSKSHHPVTEEEYVKMLSVLTPHEPMPLQRRLMLMMLWDTGVRGGELLRIRLADLKPRHAFINNEKNRRQRLVSWSDETEELLQFYLHLRNEMSTKEDWLFVSFHWKPTRQMTTRQLERIVYDTRILAGVTTLVRPHSFRHGFVHRKLRQGTPITTVSQMLGHSSTMNVINYAQLSSKELHEAWGM